MSAAPGIESGTQPAKAGASRTSRQTCSRTALATLLCGLQTWWTLYMMSTRASCVATCFAVHAMPREAHGQAEQRVCQTAACLLCSLHLQRGSICLLKALDSATSGPALQWPRCFACQWLDVLTLTDACPCGGYSTHLVEVLEAAITEDITNRQACQR